jgi:hypothetical protein
MGVNILRDGGRLDHFLIDQIVNLIIIDQHDRAIFFSGHRNLVER